ncbi:flagellar motor stator protein MotA [Desulfofalx alkaliphila]|uniref:flagellar motor stator protein MotA n=1 Tax=Desulfofalx alkaliphila TaxID=105483 RepID=UPI0004E1765D|nr:flagellar motor stator protein MotA [Desulfofalx alkaliphila]
MEKSTFIGIVAGVLAVVLGLIFKGASLSALWNPAAYIIIFGGTFACLFVGFPMGELKRLPAVFRIVFLKQNLIPKAELVKLFVNLAVYTRREGLLALESQMDEIDDRFLKNGIQMVVDGTEPGVLKNVLMEEIYATEERHRVGALMFSQAGTYAPTLGVLGAVIGLITALGNLADVDKLGESIAAAFVATLLGIFSGYVLWHPMANKVKRLSKREIELKEMMIEGVLSIQLARSPIIIEQNLLVYLSPEERQQYLAQKESAGNG